MRSWLARIGIAAAIVAGPRMALADEPPKSASAKAEQPRVTLLPAVIEDGARRRPTAAETEVTALLDKLDELLADTARDMGLAESPKPSAPLPDPTTVTDRELFDLATSTKGSVIAATARPDGAEIELRVSLASPSRRAMHTRTERFPKDDLAVRAVVMLRDVIQDAGLIARPTPEASPAKAPPGQMAVATRSEGRAVLAANATVFGGMLGFSVERASGSDDPRLLYPLLAVGAGVGLGASLLVAEEWDISAPMAWQVAGGTWWGVGSGLFLASGFNVAPLNDRFFWAIAGGGIGVTAATIGLVRRRVDDGGMLLTQSSAALGTFVGGLIEILAVGPRDPIERPTPLGWGFGSSIGFGTGAFFATFLKVAPSRVLLVDLGLALGALAGAAIASPLIVDHLDPDKTRGWVVATLAGTVLGGGAAFFFTRNIKPAQTAWRYGTPWAGVVGTPLKDGVAPAFGGGWQGSF